VEGRRLHVLKVALESGVEDVEMIGRTMKE